MDDDLKFRQKFIEIISHKPIQSPNYKAYTVELIFYAQSDSHFRNKKYHIIAAIQDSYIFISQQIGGNQQKYVSTIKRAGK